MSIKTIKDPTFNIYNKGGRVENVNKATNKKDLIKLADAEKIEFDVQQDILDTLMEDFEKQKKPGETFMEWIDKKDTDYFKRIKLNKGGKVVFLSDYIKSKQPKGVKEINLADSFEFGRTVSSLTDAEKEVVNKLLRMSLGKED